MKQKTNFESLNDEIRLLESKQAYEFEILRQQFHKTADGLKPLNLISNTLREVVTFPATGNSLIDSTIGMATGFLTKKLMFGTSTNPIKRGLGTLMQFGISNIVYKNSIAIKAIGGTILQSIFSKKRDVENSQDTLPNNNAGTRIKNL
jgi:hypothetical protein